MKLTAYEFITWTNRRSYYTDLAGALVEVNLHYVDLLKIH